MSETKRNPSAVIHRELTMFFVNKGMDMGEAYDWALEAATLVVKTIKADAPIEAVAKDNVSTFVPAQTTLDIIREDHKTLTAGDLASRLGVSSGRSAMKVLEKRGLVVKKEFSKAVRKYNFTWKLTALGEKYGRARRQFEPKEGEEMVYTFWWAPEVMEVLGGKAA